jgi:hypothetical protein
MRTLPIWFALSLVAGLGCSDRPTAGAGAAGDGGIDVGVAFGDAGRGAGSDALTSGPPSWEAIWGRAAGGPSAEDEIDAVASDSAGNVYISGKFEQTITIGPHELVSAGGADIFVASYDSEGRLRWVKHYGGAGADNIYDATCDGEDHLILSGQFEQTVDFGEATDGDQHRLTSVGGPDVVVLKLDASGKVLWARRAGSSAADGGNEVAVDAQNNIIVGIGSAGDFAAGAFSYSHVGQQDAYVAKLDAAGRPQWVRRLAGPKSQRAKAIAVDKDGAIYFGGDLRGSARLEREGEGQQEIDLVSAGSFDAFAVKWSSNGRYLWHLTWGGSGDELCKGIVSDGEGNAYLVGTFNSEVDFRGRGSDGGKTLRSTSRQDVFAWKVDGDGQPLWLRHIASPDGVGGPEVERAPNGGVVFGGSVAADTTVGYGDTDSVAVPLSDGKRRPILFHFDADGAIRQARLEPTISDGRYGELSRSGDNLFVDLVYFGASGANVIAEEPLPSFGNKDFAIIAYRWQ